jgi:hypothetical protein
MRSRSGCAGASFAGAKSDPGGCGRGGSPALNGVGCSAMSFPPHLHRPRLSGCEVRRVVAPERDYSPYNIKDIDRPVILERMISAPGKSRPAQVPGLQHSRNIVAPATFRPT